MGVTHASRPFLSRTVVKDVKVENRIGDAIVHRIIRAHRERTPWKCCIMIPLLPGFTFPVDHPDASAVRHCLLGYFLRPHSYKWNFSICRSGLSSSVRTVPFLADRILPFPGSERRELMYVSSFIHDNF